MGRMLCLLRVIALLCAIAPASRARAFEPEPRVRVAVLPVQFVGKIETHEKQQLEERWLAALQQGDVSFVEPAAVREAHVQADACTDAECYRSVTNAVDATHVVRLSIGLEARDYTVLVEIAEGGRGKVLATSDHTCEICGQQELADMIAGEAAAVLRRLEVIESSDAVLVVESSPPGATVLVDGEVVGTTPLEAAVSPGEHRLRIEKQGYAARMGRVNAVMGLRERVAFHLTAAEERDRLSPWGWSSFGLGLATVATGVTLVVLDERPIERKCNGDNVDEDGDCRLLHDTMAGGIAATVAGGVLTAVGVALVVVAKRRKKEGRARAILGPTGAALEVRF